mmetsp:Transcript_11709/g.20743  ORF Transcript_11709/g.20743 Transcript_11709/m.20743 type:complete len:209 (-) Transcript_11709:1759-2385(-)
MSASPRRNARSFVVLVTIFSSSGVKGGAKRSPKGPNGLAEIAGPTPGSSLKGEMAASCLPKACSPERPRQSTPFTVSSTRNSLKKAPSADKRKVKASRAPSLLEASVAAAQDVGRSPTRRSFICSRRSPVSVLSVSCTSPAPPEACEAAALAAISSASGAFSVSLKASRARRRSMSRSASKLPSLPYTMYLKAARRRSEGSVNSCFER